MILPTPARRPALSRRRLLAGVGRGAAGAGLAPLLDSARAAGQTPAPTPGTATLAFLNTADPVGTGLATLVAAYQKTSGVAIASETLQTPDLLARLRQALGGDKPKPAPDCFVLRPEWRGEFAQAGRLLDLTDRLADPAAGVDQIAPAVREAAMRWRGRDVALAFSPYIFIQHYRADLYAKYHLSPATTYDEFTANAKAIQQGEKANGLAGLAFAGRGAALAYFWLADAASHGGFPFARFPQEPWDFTPTLNSPPNVATLELYRSWLPLAPSTTLNDQWFDVGKAFWTGAVGQMHHLSPYALWEEHEIAAIGNKTAVAGKVGWGPAPAADPSQRRSGLDGWSLAINAASPRADAAWAFLTWLTSVDQQKALARDPANGYADPTKRAVLADPALQQVQPALPVVAMAQQTAFGFRPPLAVWPEIEAILAQKLGQALAGELSSQQALDQANEAAKPILARAGLH